MIPLFLNSGGIASVSLKVYTLKTFLDSSDSTIKIIKVDCLDNRMKRTIKLKIGHEPSLLATIESFNKVCQFFLDLGFAHRTYNKGKLQKLGYAGTRKAHPALQSSLAQKCAISYGKLYLPDLQPLWTQG